MCLNISFVYITISEGVSFLPNQKPSLSMTNICKVDRHVLWLVKFADYFYIADDKEDNNVSFSQYTRVSVYMKTWKIGRIKTALYGYKELLTKIRKLSRKLFWSPGLGVVETLKNKWQSEIKLNAGGIYQYLPIPEYDRVNYGEVCFNDLKKKHDVLRTCLSWIHKMNFLFK